MKQHKEFQFAWSLFPMMAIVQILGVILYITGAGDRPVNGVGLSILVGSSQLVFALFYGMTTILDPEKITVLFGIGLIKKRFALNKIKEVSVVKNPWYYGWGIRYVPHGKLYNISGLKGVELTFYSTDRIIRIGTQDPAKLKNEIEKFVKR